MPKIKKYQNPNTGINNFNGYNPIAFKFASSVTKNFNNSLNQPMPKFNFKTGTFGSNLTIGAPQAQGLGSNLFGKSTTSVGGAISDKGSSGFMDGIKGIGKDALGSAPEIAELGIKALGGKEATIQGVGDKIFQTATTALFKGSLKTGNPFLIAGAGVLKLADLGNRYLGKTANKQGTDASLNTGGYAMQMSQGAGQKGTVSKRKLIGNINQQTKQADRSNLLAGSAAFKDYQNKLSAANTAGDIYSKNQQQLYGGLGTKVLSAKSGAKINPKKLSNIKKKAQYNVKKAQMGNSLDDGQKLSLGGKLNVIPDGALHARKNNYNGELAEQVTAKGIPVISYEEDGKIIQHAEIEHSEIIFTKEVTLQLEKWEKEYKETEDLSRKKELECECGKYLTEQILENTEDNMNLIEQTT